MTDPTVHFAVDDEIDLVPLLPRLGTQQRSLIMTRQCGSCSMCCYVPSIAEMDKPANVWCRHCDPPHGCRIYEQRPQTCRNFVCRWLADETLGDEWYPARAKFYLYWQDSAGQISANNVKVLSVNVHRDYPRRWREPPYYQALQSMALTGLQRKRWYTQVIVGERNYLLLGKNNIVDDPPSPLTIRQIGPDEFVGMAA